jgi:hypothetical protein
MSVTISKTNKPLNPRAKDLSPKGYNRASLYSGKALDFDGVNDEVTTGQDLGNLQTLSVAMYCRIDNMTDGSGRSPISQWNSSNGWMIYKSGGASRLIFYRNGNSFTWDDSITFNNQWIHLVYVIEQGVGAYVYANGELVASDTSYTSNLSYSTFPTVKIGTYTNTSIGFLNGGVSGVKIFNTALTAGQVSDLYLNPEKIVPDGVADSALKLWLPMMEGAGTTAYDGSGNGNHGTINGATWVYGIGAPVAQTALVSWNKGTNLLPSSEDYNFAGYTRRNISVTEAYAVSPDGTQNASLLTPSGTDSAVLENIAVTSGTTYAMSVWLKSATGSNLSITIALGSAGFPESEGDGGKYKNITVTTEWQRFSIVSTADASVGTDISIGGFNGLATGENILAWGWQFEQASSVGSYIPTLATAQTSPVLLPQGLTANKDITGVNAFENPRNAYALNLDGASWGEVHDNESLDLTTNLSLEVWCYPTEEGNASGRELIGKFISSAQPYECYALEYRATQFNFGIGATDNTWNSLYSSAGKSIKNWYHVVATYDGATRRIYINGVEENTQAFTKTPQTTDKNISIGRWLGQAVGGTNTFFGPIAQPRIYNRALTATEVARNYNADKSKFGL